MKAKKNHHFKNYFEFGNPGRGNYISTRDIFELIDDKILIKDICGIEVNEGEKILSPLRPDHRPGTWFETLEDGRLYFRDFAAEYKPLNSIEFCQRYLGLKDYDEAKRYIFEYLLDTYKLKNDYKYVKKDIKKKIKKIGYRSRIWDNDDYKYWLLNSATELDYIKADYVKPIEKMFNDEFVRGYSFLEFYPRYKLYFPGNDPKFLGTVLKDDIGNIHNIDKEGDNLIIGKSYKDTRILRTKGIKNVVWFQSENTFPSVDLLRSFIVRYERIVIFFDNDIAGRKGAYKLLNLFKELGAKYVELIFPFGDYNDLSDMLVDNYEICFDFIWKNFRW